MYSSVCARCSRTWLLLAKYALVHNCMRTNIALTVSGLVVAVLVEAEAVCIDDTRREQRVSTRSITGPETCDPGMLLTPAAEVHR